MGEKLEAALLFGLIIALILCYAIWYNMDDSLQTLAIKLDAANQKLAAQITNEQQLSLKDASQLKAAANELLEIRKKTCLALNSEVGGNYDQQTCKNIQNVAGTIALLDSSLDNIISAILVYNALNNTNPTVNKIVRDYYSAVKTMFSFYNGKNIDDWFNKAHAEIEQWTFNDFQSGCKNDFPTLGTFFRTSLFNIKSDIQPSLVSAELSRVGINDADAGTNLVNTINHFTNTMNNIGTLFCNNMTNITSARAAAHAAINRLRTEYNRLANALLLHIYPIINRIANDSVNNTMTSGM